MEYDVVVVGCLIWGTSIQSSSVSKILRSTFFNSDFKQNWYLQVKSTKKKNYEKPIYNSFR